MRLSLNSLTLTTSFYLLDAVGVLLKLNFADPTCDLWNWTTQSPADGCTSH